MIINYMKVIRFFATAGRKTTAAGGAKHTKSAYESFQEDLNNKDVYRQFQKQAQKDTILKKFRRDIFKKQQISQQARAYQEELQKQNQAMQSMLNKGSKQEVVKYSKKIMQKIMNRKKIFKQRTINPSFSDYGDYSSYKTNYVKIQDRNLGQLQRLDMDQITQNLYQFIDELPDQYQQKRQIRQNMKRDFVHSSNDMSISQYGKLMQQNAELRQHFTEGKQFYHQNHRSTEQKQYRNLSDKIADLERAPERSVDLQNQRQTATPRLSPQAVDTIYQCYLQGWTVRDISKRFGILPQRTKFCIWTRAQLYDELIPKYGWKFYHEGLQAQLQLGQQHGYQDYGLDFSIMLKRRLPEEIQQWTSQRIDAQRKEQEYTQALQKLDNLKKFDRHMKVEIGTHGRQNKMYLLKEWTIFRGKGSDQYFLRNKTFKHLTKATKKMVKEYY